MESADTTNFWLRLAKALGPDSLIKALSGAPVLWACLRRDGSTAYKIHRAFYRETWKGTDISHRLVYCLGFMISIPFNLAISILLTWRCGTRVRHIEGKGITRQLVEQFVLYSTKAVPSPWYYMFDLFKGDNRARALEFLYRFETKASLYPSLREHLSDPHTTEALRDKAEFAERCLRHQLPAVRALGTMRKGKLERLDAEESGLPRCDLFLKPISGAGGRGASRWIFGEDGLYHGNLGTAFDESGLINFLAELSQTEGYVIREFVTNHDDLTDLVGGVLSTVRVVTCLDERGCPEVLHAVMRIASKPGVIVDNFHAGGVAAAVDLETGRLSRATDMGMGAESSWWDSHPVNGAPIAGRTVPMWRDVLTLALRAHAVFPDHVAIGWDIAVCNQGPLLVEGNKSPDLDIIQRVTRQPLGNTRFGKLFLFHIERAFAGERDDQPRVVDGISVNRQRPFVPATHGPVSMTTSDGTAKAIHSVDPPFSRDSSTMASIFEIEAGSDRSDPALRERALVILEHGGVVYLPDAGFQLSDRERALLVDTAVTLPTRRERESRNGRPTVIFDPELGHILHSRMPQPERGEMEALMARYSDWATALVGELFPDYVGNLERDRITYRPCERIDPQGLHIDASYGRPTEGRGMLRVFCNINPEGRTRVWRIGETFEPFARRFLPTAKPPCERRVENVLARLGAIKGRRTAYDRLMADIRGQVKRNREYQQVGPQRVVSFPSGSAWIAITDLVLHAAMAGQHSLDQTFFLPAEAMREPECSSLRILETMGGYNLV